MVPFLLRAKTDKIYIILHVTIVIALKEGVVVVTNKKMDIKETS